MNCVKTAIQTLDKEMGQRVRKYIDNLTKPPGSLGRLEELAIQLAEMTSEVFPVVSPPGVIVFAADHGVVEEGVSAFPQEVTVQMVMNFLNSGAAINVFSRQIGAMFEVVDVGIATDIEADGLVNRKIRYGTSNFCKQDAMTRKEVESVIAAGYERAENMIGQGCKCLILGEMGIGNTTASSAILAVLSGQDVSTLVGRETGIAVEKIIHKQQVIVRALDERKPDRKDPIDILAKIGGLEIAAMTGAMLSAAANRVPILVDGFIAAISALLAKEICSTAIDYMIVGHCSVEPGHKIALKLLSKKPLLDLELCLGEGSGAAVAFPILTSATLMLKEMATFASAGISKE
ncbi:nicotinate-nucleotide--dimethylbenzimidazole phosphoribosyltransferase [Peribacillus saganii]|uniref:Nicotinate-nucleotide--dimethylbenzimidazole phosphoribosyltransferase n=1 Tax=Peribacillus saganii TaxID=2303992 RepID=A0A372LEY1_9BACI|nr:nicotinate-nucleotide--dimethylbenzimidazole phosphoribosyltransferase [Peribacillus saganii]RFU64471.1 nicotinate-nucleotide--dimethylbenzimidazole phosphoribosyltransferase [Peribacillus saganii]